MINFTTAGSVPSLLVTNLTGVSVTGTLTLLFSGSIQQGANFGNSTLNNTGVPQIPAINGNMLKFNYASLNYDADYTIEIPAGALIPDQGVSIPVQTLNFNTVTGSGQQPSSSGGGGGGPLMLSLTTTWMTAGTVGQPYNQTVTTNGAGTAPYTFSAPGMGESLWVRVPYGGWQCQPLANGKGVHGDVGSEGSRRQNPGPTNRNLMSGGRTRASLLSRTKPDTAKGCVRR